MRLQRIYSSKLYVTSTRKDKIHAAMQDPINAELVQQLEEYLSDDAKAELKRAIIDEKQSEQAAAPAADTSTDTGFDGGGRAPSTSHGGGSHSSFTGDLAADFGDDDLADLDAPEASGDDASTEAPAPEEAPEPVESVTQEGKPITSSTTILWTTLDDVVADTDTIKGTLNAREDTTGVNRLEVKDSELWIYYNDDCNLNDKMIEVIGVLNATGYTYLKFNRLARSNNAIVFDIILNSTPIKTVKEIEETEK